ncbi:uncharacterized protein LOC126886471 [Diabrotica virgifera virgifera]|uniref:CHK kinase-like domain-containing protein n=1 Tax=Diabrotica virgifera virgifera TaxID=50390 RepID=A0ABM5KGS3_DIAVI|nr:uncharacterized protein LOC126886471 [Diabrotica virgifera virgifera]
MEIEPLKVLLEVILQELHTDNNKNEDYLPKNSFNLSKKLFNGVVPDILENVVSDIKKKAEEESKKEDSVRKITYKALVAIFRNTTQHERFLYLQDLLNHFYNQLVQKLIELKQHKSIISIEDFNEIVTTLLPFVKLQVLKDMSENEKNSEKSKVGLMELYETVLYPNITREDCYEIIKNKKVDYKDVEFVDFEIKPVDEKNGFLGDYFKLKIYIKINEKNELHQLFLKHMPLNSDEMRKAMSEMSFKKEEKFYVKIIPYLRKLGFGDITDFLPECYLTRKGKFMVFDDISAQNFSNLDIQVPFTYHQLSLVYKQLAKFHCCGILFEEKLSEMLGIDFRMDNYFGDMLKETFAIKGNEQTRKMFDCTVRTNDYIFDKFPHVFKPGTLENFKKKCGSMMIGVFDIVEPSKTVRNFVTHGDLWCNNFLYDSNQTACLLLDFQILRYCLPSYDAYFIMAINTDFKTRIKSGLRLLDEYYNDIKSILSKYNININKIMPYDQFLRNIEEVKPYALLMSLFYMPLMLFPKEKLAHVFQDPEQSQMFFVEDRSKVMEKFWPDLKCKSRFEDAVQELYLVLNKE